MTRDLDDFNHNFIRILEIQEYTSLEEVHRRINIRIRDHPPHLSQYEIGMLCAIRTGNKNEFWIGKIHSMNPEEGEEKPIKVRWYEMNEKEKWTPFEAERKKDKYGHVALGAIIHHNFSLTSKNKLSVNTRKKIEKILNREKKAAENVI